MILQSDNTLTQDTEAPGIDRQTDKILIPADELATHPVAEILPMMTPEQLDDLTRSIECIGQQAPVIMFDEMILDGRNRVEACRRLGYAVEVTSFNGTLDEAVEFVTDTNLQRREMTASC